MKEKLEIIEKEIEEKNRDIKLTLERIEHVVNNFLTSSKKILPTVSKSSIPTVNLATTTTHGLTTTTTSSVIPQLDGTTNRVTPSSSQIPNISPCISQNVCENCDKTFKTADELEQHSDIFQFGCED